MKRILFTASRVAVAALLTLAIAKCSLVHADEIYDWSGTAANNNAAPPDGFPENMNYSEVNDAARELMAVVKRYVEATDGTNVTTGTQPAYALTSGQSLSTGAAGRVHVWTAHATSTGSVTLNVDAAGAKNVVDAFGTQLGSGAVAEDGIYMTVEDGTNHRIIGTFSAPPVGGPASSTDNAIARFNGTEGQVLQNSGITIDDSNNVAGVGTIASGAITSSAAVSGTSLVSSGAITAAGALTGATTIDIGNADTTLSRASAGNVNVEGNTLYRAGGTDVPVTDGGTGSSNAAAARIALAALGAVSTQEFTSSGTWTKPANCQYILVIGTGGGAGGEDSNSTNVGAASGGAGATSIELIDVSAISSVSVTIGAGGGSGANGNDTTFGAHFTAGGGQASTGVNGGVGGTATGGSLNISGGGGGGAADNGSSGSGGASFWGSGGEGQRVSGSGNDGLAYGSGGSGGFSTGSTAGGSGADGVVFVLEFGS